MAAKPEVIEQAKKWANDYKTIPNMLTELERQRAYIAALHIQQVPCWLCAEPSNFYEAVEESYDPEHYQAGRKFFCPHCKTEMIHVVPLFAASTIAGWFWGNPKIYRREGGKT